MTTSAAQSPQTGNYRSVLAELQNVLPHGTQPLISTDNDLPADLRWDVLPALPTDVFGAVAHLLRVSGVMGWFEPAPECDDPASSVHITTDERALLKEWAFKWRTGEDAGPIQDLWTELVIKHASDCLRPRLLSKNRQGSLEWCRVALKLLVVADLAAEGLARPLPQDEESENVMRDLLKAKNKPERDGEAELVIAGSALKRRHRHPASMTTRIDTDVACVLPKSRVAQVGCTLRSLSANLALLPPRAAVRCQWAEPVAQLGDDDRSTLDILLIPAPFEINGIDFQERPSKGASTGRRPWGNFTLHQSWLKEASQLEETTRKLIAAAQKQTRSLNAIMFPEYALDWDSFDRICKAAWSAHPALEFIIAGSSRNCEGHEGNHVLTALRHDSTTSTGSTRPWISTVSRRKHHRWRLDARQISDYALASALNPAVDCWWESHQIRTPELYFHRFRQSSTFVTMICEDLARSVSLR